MNTKISNFSFFKKPITNTKPQKEISILEAYQLIHFDEYKEVTSKLRSAQNKATAKQFKASNFDYVTFNGSFFERADDKIKTPSNLFCVDIDKIGATLEETKERLRQDNILKPILVFTSPSGDGLKIIVRIDSSIIDFSRRSGIMKEYLDGVNTYFSQAYSDLLKPNKKGEYVDHACKDLSRPCFLCHDSEAYFNEESDVILNEEFINQYPKFKPEKETNNDIKQNPSIGIDDLAKKHLLESDNHHSEIRSFICAAMSKGFSKDITYKYLLKNGNISPESSHADKDFLFHAINDIYERYDDNCEDVIDLSPLEFAYDIMLFKYESKVKKNVASSLYHVKVLELLKNEGYFKRRIGNDIIFVQRIGCILKEVIPDDMQMFVTSYVDSIEDYNFRFKGTTYNIPKEIVIEKFLKSSHIFFNSSWLKNLSEDTSPIMKDEANKIFFNFKNVHISVTREGIQLLDWNEVTNYSIWEDQISKHNFNYVEDFTNSEFYKFIRNVTNHDDDRYNTITTGIGYLLHHHFNDSEGQAVIFYDEKITDLRRPEGGTGKGLIVNAIKQVRTVTKVDGKHLDASNRFKWELVTPSTQVVWLDDVKTNFEFSILHSNLTDGWTVERKHKSQFVIAPIDSPKTVICSNSIVQSDGSTNKRRQFIIELSDYYSKQIKTGIEKPIEEEHNGLFFGDTSWNANEWDLFYSFMLTCAYDYLIKGLIHHKGINVELNKLKQSTNEDFFEWVQSKSFEINEYYETSKNYNEYLSIYYGTGSNNIQQRTFSSYLKSFAQFKQWKYDTKQSNGISYFIFK